MCSNVISSCIAASQSTFYRMNEPAETQEGKVESEPEDFYE